MQEKPTVGVYLDTRSPSKKNGGKFPVKVRITFEIQKNNKTVWKPEYVHTGQYVSVDEYKAIETGKAKGSLKDTQEKIFAVRAKVAAIINDERNKFIGINQFFLLYNGEQKIVSNSLLIKDLFKEVIEAKTKIGKTGTASYYNDAMGSLLAFGGENLNLLDITAEWCKEYEVYTVLHGNRLKTKKVKKTEVSINTVSAYLRALRAVYRKAIKDKLIGSDRYPFGEDGYAFRRKRVKKKPIPASLVKQLTAPVEKEAMAEAMDYLLFSYYCNGMNFADMAFLSDENFTEKNTFKFVRRKTMDTVKEQKEIEIWISSEIRAILNRRRKLGSYYIFGIITPEMSSKEKDRKIQQWRRKTNKWFKKLARKLGYPSDVTGQRLRHSFTTALLNAGVPLPKIKDALGHTLITTTDNYAEDLDIEDSKSISQIINPQASNF